MRQGIDRGVVFGIGLLAVLMLGIAATSYLNTRRLQNNADQVTKSQDLVDAIHAAQFDTVRLQADLRSYMITGFPESLPAYHESAARLRTDLAVLAEQVRNDLEHQPHLESAQQEIVSGIAGFDMAVQLRGGPDGHAAILDLSRKRSNRSFVAPLIETLGKMERIEKDRLGHREAYSLVAYKNAILYAIFAAILGLTAVGLFVQVLSRSTRLRTRDSLRLSEQRELLSATLTSIGDAVIATDAAGTVTFLNPVAERLTGWPQAEARGISLEAVFNIVNESTRLPVSNPVSRAAKDGLANHTVLISKDGTERPIEDSAAPIRTGGGVNGAVLVFRDVTEKKQAERTIRERVRIATLGAEVGLALTRETTLSKMLNECAKSLVVHADAAFARIWTLNANQDVLELQASAGMYTHLDGPHGRVPVGQFKIGRIALERTPHLTNDVIGDPRVAEQDWARREGLVAFAGYPLVVAEQVVGVMALFARHRLSDAILQAMASVSNEIALGIARAQKEAALFKSEEQLRFALAAARMGTWELDLATGQFASSDSCKQNYGHHADEPFTYETLIASVHHHDRAAWQTTVDDAIERVSEFQEEYRTIWPDGSEHWVQVRGSCTPGPTGRTRSLSGVSYDVTRRKRIEEGNQLLADASASIAELVDYESTLQRIANLAVGSFADWCVVDVLDAGGQRRRLEVNGMPAAAARGVETAVGVPHVLRTGEPELVADVAALDPATARQGPDRIERLRTWGIASYLAVPLLSRGRVIGGITFLMASPRRRYGTEELLLAQELALRVTTAIENTALYKSLQDQDRRKDEFLATLAHELRNPLAPVRNGVQILRATLPHDERTGKALAMMDRQLGHMVHLVDDLMDLARVSSGKVVLRYERVELQSIVEAAVESTRTAIETGGHELAIHLPAEPLAFDGDRTRLVQVLVNLLSNAAKYTPHGGRITLTATRVDSLAVIKVADTGVGISAEMLPRVFEMFTQVGTSLERSQGGLGIGLTLVRRLVEMHSGTVSAESPGPGQGSTFSVRLSLAAPSPLARTPDQEGDVRTAGRLRILVVDDNVDAAESLSMLLELLGHEVRTAHNGPEALRVLGSYRPQLILLDIGLPGMTGYEVARRIRESEAHGRVTLAALTGWGQDEDRRRSREAGFDYHLTKPADTAEVERILNTVIAKSDTR